MARLKSPNDRCTRGTHAVLTQYSRSTHGTHAAREYFEYREYCVSTPTQTTAKSLAQHHGTPPLDSPSQEKLFPTKSSVMTIVTRSVRPWAAVTPKYSRVSTGVSTCVSTLQAAVSTVNFLQTFELTNNFHSGSDGNL